MSTGSGCGQGGIDALDPSLFRSSRALQCTESLASGSGHIPTSAVYKAPTRISSQATTGTGSDSASASASASVVSNNNSSNNEKGKEGYYLIWIALLLLGWVAVMSFVVMKIARGRVFIHR